LVGKKVTSTNLQEMFAVNMILISVCGRLRESAVNSKTGATKSHDQ
jgi:hypothetical protein